jgi:hypothetical protein
MGAEKDVGELLKVKKQLSKWKEIAKTNKERIKELEEELETLLSKVTTRKKKLTPEVSVAKIKILINKYYEELGRGDEDFLDNKKRELIYGIEKTLEETNIPEKLLIIEEFQYEKDKNP